MSVFPTICWMQNALVSRHRTAVFFYRSRIMPAFRFGKKKKSFLIELGTFICIQAAAYLFLNNQILATFYPEWNTQFKRVRHSMAAFCYGNTVPTRDGPWSFLFFLMTNQPKFLCDLTYGLRLVPPYCLKQFYRTIITQSHRSPFNCPGAISRSMPLQGQAPLLKGRLSSWWEGLHHFRLHTLLVQTVCFSSRRSGEPSKTISRAGLLKWRIQDKSKSWINGAWTTPWLQTWTVCDVLWRVSCSFLIFWCHSEETRLATFGTCESAVEQPSINMAALCWGRVQWSQI